MKTGKNKNSVKPVEPKKGTAKNTAATRLYEDDC